MKAALIRSVSMLLCLCLLAGLCPSASAAGPRYWYRYPIPPEENDPSDPNAAQNISGHSLLDGFYGFYQSDFLFDGRTTFAEPSVDSAYITLTIRFPHGSVSLCEISVFTPGYLPGYVQVWEPAKEGQTDLILFSTHGDDDQLFFAGLLPYYCALDYEVLVVYMSDHSNCHSVRVHEMLNGLWAVGVTTYPVLGDYPDLATKSLSNAYALFQIFGITRDDLIGFILEQLRRYQPLVVVGHDFNGEYGHGQHMAFAECLAAALELSGDPTQYRESANAYGTWEVPKAYFHLYPENPVVMDWDTPMEALNGLSPFQVSQLYGYPQHLSQQSSWVSNWINGQNFSITRADQITSYSPCLYGLYRSTVGADVLKNDFFENLQNYSRKKTGHAPPFFPLPVFTD